MFTTLRPVQFRKSSRHLFVTLTILAMTSLLQPGYAAEVSWLNSADSFWGFIPSNWSNGTFAGPTAADDAVFDRGITHNVFFNLSPTNNRLLVRNDDVSFTLNGFTYTLTDPSSASDVPVPSVSITVGQSAGQVGNLNLLGSGTLSGQGMFVGLNNSTGTLTVNSLVTLENSQAVIIGKDGTGTLNVVGPDATWTNTSSFTDFTRIGEEPGSSGTLNVLAGGSVTFDVGTLIGNQYDSAGFATVSGAGSTWTNNALFLLGFSGAGTLNIEAGGAVHNTTDRKSVV